MSFAKDFKRQPDPLDIAKKLGLSRGSGSNLAATAGIALSTSLSTAAPSMTGDDAESMPESNVESWVELAPSRASLCSSIEAVMLESASGGENSASKDSRLSPVSLQSPHVEFETSLEQVKYRLVKDMLPLAAADGAKSTDWLWDWSSRSEGGGAIAVQKAARHRSGGQIGSTLTTPPNSPEPESSDFEFKMKASNRSIGGIAKKRGMAPKGAGFEFGLLGLVVSNLVVFIVGTALGFYICWKGKFWKSNADPFEGPMRFNYF